MISNFALFIFYSMIGLDFIMLCYIFLGLIDRAEKKEQRRNERKQRQAERRQLRESIYQSEVAVALNKADVALKGAK